jgi:predicted nucleotidyltransferase
LTNDLHADLVPCRRGPADGRRCKNASGEKLHLLVGRRIHRHDGQAKVVEVKAPVCYICVMKRDEAISRLQQHEADLKRLGVEHLYMFGSTARDEAGDDSDVDLFFDHEKGKLGLFELMDVKERAASILGGKTDIMTRNSLHPRLRKQIEEAAVLIF